MTAHTDIADLAAVVYSSGKVFDGLQTGRLDTENFLRSGSLDGVTSRSDLALLEDLRDASRFILDHTGALDAGLVCALNATLTRSAALHPGRLRTADQQIGVDTRYRRHSPPPVSMTDLQTSIDRATTTPASPQDKAITLFIELAKAQPFEDGNKRTALFTANRVLLEAGSGMLLTIPVDEKDPALSNLFNDLLAAAYVFGDDTGVTALLHARGLVELPKSPERRNARRRVHNTRPADEHASPDPDGGLTL